MTEATTEEIDANTAIAAAQAQASATATDPVPASASDLDDGSPATTPDR